MSEVWSISEASRATGISRGTLHRMRRDGRLAAFEVQNGARRGLRPEVGQFLKAGGCRPRVDSPWASWNQPREEVPAPRISEECRGRHEFWSEYGRIASPSEPDLTDEEFWQHVAAIASGMTGEPMTALEASNLRNFLNEAVRDVEAGVRWDSERWNRARVLTLLPELPGCAAAAAELRRLLEDGQVEDALVPRVQEALAAAAAGLQG